MSQIKIIIAQRNPWSRTKKNTICARKYFHEFGLSDNYEITSHLYPSFCFAPAPYHQERESKAPGQDDASVSPDTFLLIGINSTELKLTDNLFVPIYLYVLATFLSFFLWFLAMVVTRTSSKKPSKRCSVGPIVLVKTGGWFIKTENAEKTNVQIKDKTHKEIY